MHPNYYAFTLNVFWGKQWPYLVVFYYKDTLCVGKTSQQFSSHVKDTASVQYEVIQWHVLSVLLGVCHIYKLVLLFVLCTLKPLALDYL